MTRDDAVQFASECWEAYKVMPIDKWRAMVNARTMGQDERWRKQALAWMEMNFSVAREAGMK